MKPMANTSSPWSCWTVRRSSTGFRQRPLKLELLLHVAIQIADALDAAQSKGDYSPRYQAYKDLCH
jgi:hypothetical protein